MKPMRKRLYIVVLNVIAIGVWAFQFYHIGFPSRDVMLNDSDSLGYIAVGDWLFGGSFTPLISIRTFLFPLWIKCIIGAFGMKGFFITQSLMWLASINLLHQSLIKLRLHQLVSILFAIVFCFNLTLLSVSYEVLSETATVFLCCVFIYCVARCGSTAQLRGQIGSLLFISALLMLLKPLFEPLFLVLLAAVIYFLFREKNSIEKKKKLRWLAVSLLPVAVQLFIMLCYLGSFSLSGVAELNWRDYFISNALNHAEHTGLTQARQMVAGWSILQTIQFAVQHIPELTKSYFTNFHLNTSAYPNHVSAIGSPGFEVSFMIWWNRLHWIAQIVLPFLLILSWKKISRQPLAMWQVIIIAISMYDVMLLTSISFSQGDRLVIPAIPFLVVLYAILIKTYLPRNSGSEFDQSQ